MSSELETFSEIQKIVYLIRGQRVMLDSDLARLYGVETKALNQAVKRNIDRFPRNSRPTHGVTENINQNYFCKKNP
jgi:hypothetical protein